MNIDDVFIENLKEPVGLDTRHPRLRWLLSPTETGAAQTAWQVQVASSSTGLTEGAADWWDSGKVAGADPWTIYAGQPLQSRDRCHVRVRVWDEHDAPSPWSAPCLWVMGLLKADDWHGEWIGLDRQPDANEDKQTRRRLPVHYVRHEFTLSTAPQRATLYGVGLGYHRFSINGRRSDDHELDPILRDYDHQVPYVTLEVTGALRKGANALGVMLGAGRYYAPHLTVPWKTKDYGTPCLRIQLELEFEDGHRQIIASRPGWKGTDTGPIRNNNDYDGEWYDARMELPGWDEPGFNDEGWEPTVQAPTPKGKMTSAACMQPMTIIDTLAPIAVCRLDEHRQLVDFGQNLVGRCRIRVQGEAGREMILHHAELCNKDGTPYYANLRDAECTDRYTLRGGGPEEWAPVFTYHGFRYVEVTGWPGDMSPEDIHAEVIHTRMDDAGAFTCSDDLINHIVRNAWWGISGNYLSMPTDCPQRDERHGWQGDRAEAQKGEMFLFDNTALYEKWLGDVRDTQRADGSLSDTGPAYWNIYNNSITWPASLPIITLNMYHITGDRRVVEDNYDTIVRWMAFNRARKKDGILDCDCYGDWCCPPERPELIHSEEEFRRTPNELLATSYYYHVLGVVEAMATLLGRADEAGAMRREAEEIRAAFNEKLFNADTGRYGSGSQTSQVLPLAFGLVPPERRKQVAEYLIHHIEHVTDGHIGTGLIGGQWLMRTLHDLGRNDLALRIATQRDYPSWGYMIEQGATTIWELWNGNTADPAMNSANHVMLLGDFLIWCFERLAGIACDPAAPGFRRIRMQPDFACGLTGVSAHYDSVRGRVASAWNIGEKEFQWSIEIPVGATAEIVLPAGSGQSLTLNGKAPAQAGDVLQLPSGHYTLTWSVTP